MSIESLFIIVVVGIVAGWLAGHFVQGTGFGVLGDLVIGVIGAFIGRLTDSGVQFCYQPSQRSGPTARYMTHMFDLRCRQNGIEHRLTKPNHPWTNGQVERMNRTIKEATVRRYHYETRDQLEAHLASFLDAYNFAKRLKTLRGLTLYEYICGVWTKQPDRFKLDPAHLTAGLHT
jgi:transposase InsO family protein